MSCGEKEEETSSASLKAAKAAMANDPTMLSRRGQALFQANCVVCHGAEGTGMTQVPPINDSPYVQGDPLRLVVLLAKGLKGPMTLHGVSYIGQEMPAWEKRFSTGEWAALLTYLRHSWKNQDAIQAEQRVITESHAQELLDRLAPQVGPMQAIDLESDAWKKFLKSDSKN